MARSGIQFGERRSRVNHRLIMLDAIMLYGKERIPGPILREPGRVGKNRYRGRDPRLATARDTLNAIGLARGTRARLSVVPSSTAWQRNGNISTESSWFELIEADA
jgi:hypothetical protein